MILEGKVSAGHPAQFPAVSLHGLQLGGGVASYSVGRVTVGHQAVHVARGRHGLRGSVLVTINAIQ